MNPEKSNVSLEEVRHVASLANLHLTAEEEPRMQHDLNAVLGYIAELNDLDTTGVPPLAQIAELLQEPDSEWLRADAQRPSTDRAVVMHEAPLTDGRFFKVPKVIER